MIFSSCQDDLTSDLTQDSQTSFSRAEINSFIEDKTQKGNVFDWSDASIEMIHSAAQKSDEIIALGYKTDKYADMSTFIGTTDVLPEELLAKRQSIVDLVIEMESKHHNQNLELEDVLPFELDDQIPTLALKINSIETLRALEEHDDIRYIEPMGYDPGEETERSLKSSSGCSGSPGSINSNDYTRTSSFNAKIPWNFNNHRIPSAWSYANGDNISICIIDTGASDSQNNLGSQFTSGNSSSRFIQKYSTHYSGWWWWRELDSPNDQCGHGTSMAGLAAAPWGSDGNALGAAYKSNLVTVRAVEDVIISSSNEKNGVKNALILAGNRSDIKVVSMSIGNIISSGTVRDGIYYAYNRGKLLMAAAGTSTSFTNFVGVIFPANMSQTIAVTGVKAQNNYQRCNTCHSGSAVDFTIEMQRSSNTNRNSISLANYSDTPKYVGGSSAATATSAGIAALVWSTNPSMSRTSVLNRLKTASEIYPGRSGSYGWGNINAEAAVRGTGY